MAAPAQPSEIARETLRRLAMNKTPPTPNNYRAIYHEITGSKVVEPFPESSLKALHASLPRDTPEQVRFARQLETAIGAGNWQSFGTALTELLGKPGAEPLAWSALIKELVQQLDAHHAGLTSAKKRESVEHVLAASSSPELLYSVCSRHFAHGRTPVSEHRKPYLRQRLESPSSPPAASEPPAARRSLLHAINRHRAAVLANSRS
ncbi:MAG: hypothetical protein IPM01_31615 [Burkholderiaceae bacterium]|nr:hypothetical protein [Burkholderiaceae bacterium]